MVMIDNFGSILFLWFYMITIWVAVIIYWKRRPSEKQKSWYYVFYSFALLAFGDIFHLIPRTYLWIDYTFNHNIGVYDSKMGIYVYGFGLIMTGVTMIFFYLGFYLFWKEEILSKVKSNPNFVSIEKNITVFDNIAYISVILRIILILLPWNNWGTEPTYYENFWNFRLLTNLPLYVIGFEVLYLFIKTSIQLQKDNTIHPDILHAIKNSAIWIIVSFVTYSITVIGVHAYPLLGMMMIPKTIAYLIVLYYMGKYILGNQDLLK